MPSWLTNDRRALKWHENILLYRLHELMLCLNRISNTRTIMEQALAWLVSLGFGAAFVRPHLIGRAFAIEVSDGLAQPALDVLRDVLLAQGQETLSGQAFAAQRMMIAVPGERFAELDACAYTSDVGAVIALPLLTEQHQPLILLIFVTLFEDIDPALTRILELLARNVALTLDNAQAISQLKAHRALMNQRYHHMRTRYGSVAEERQMLASVLECASEAILITDSQGYIQFGNQSVEHVIGVHPDLLIGQTLMQALVPERLILLFQQAQMHRYPHEGELPLLDGRVFHVNIAPVHTGDQPIQAYVLFLKEITSFKRLNEMKSQFVTTVSHDMKSPLHLINSYAELLEMAGPLNREQSEYIERIVVSVRRLTALVSDLLDLARIEAQASVQMAPCDIVALVRSVIDEHLLIADAKHISLTMYPTVSLPLIWGNELRLRQVITNLVSNALAYTLPNGSVWISAEVNVDTVVMRIEDSGMGINQVDLQHIFDPFFRADPAREVNLEGSGLGLAIVKRIIEEHSGTIGVESVINGGSIFWFTLPVASVPAPHGASQHSTP